MISFTSKRADLKITSGGSDVREKTLDSSAPQCRLVMKFTTTFHSRQLLKVRAKRSSSGPGGSGMYPPVGELSSFIETVSHSGRVMRRTAPGRELPATRGDRTNSCSLDLPLDAHARMTGIDRILPLCSSPSDGKVREPAASRLGRMKNSVCGRPASSKCQTFISNF